MPITARQRRVLDYIKRYFEIRSEAPTIAEIGKEFSRNRRSLGRSLDMGEHVWAGDGWQES